MASQAAAPQQPKGCESNQQAFADIHNALGQMLNASLMQLDKLEKSNDAMLAQCQTHSTSTAAIAIFLAVRR